MGLHPRGKMKRILLRKELATNILSLFLNVKTYFQQSVVIWLKKFVFGVGFQI
jgi:hypothetical protein